DAVDGGDGVDFFEGLQGFDLDGHHVLVVRFATELGGGDGREAGVPAPGIEAAVAAGGELGPADEFLRLAGGEDLGGHHAARPGFVAAGDGCVVGGGDAAEGVETVRAGGERGDFELLVRDAHVLHVDPEPVEAA